MEIRCGSIRASFCFQQTSSPCLLPSVSSFCTIHREAKTSSPESTKELLSLPFISPNWVMCLLFSQSLWVGECPEQIGFNPDLWAIHFEEGSGVSLKIMEHILGTAAGTGVNFPCSSWAMHVTNWENPWLHVCVGQWHKFHSIFSVTLVAELRSPVIQEPSPSLWVSGGVGIFRFLIPESTFPPINHAEHVNK